MLRATALYSALAVAAMVTGAAAVAADAAADPLAPIPAVATLNQVTVTARALPRRTGPDALGTATLAAGVTLYDARFRRVAATDREDPGVLAIAAELKGLSRAAQLTRVKRAVESRVRLTTDLDAMGVADYWERAGDTLRRGRGDGEDIAIVEMQALAAAGFPRDDMFITVGRHPSLGAHAVLLALSGGHYIMLDATEPAAIDASLPRGGHFVPMFSMGPRGSWIHGFRRGATLTLASADR